MKTKIILVFLLFCNLWLHAQTETERKKIIAATNVDELSKLSDYYSALFKRQKAEAFLVAGKKGWKTLEITKDGKMTELMSIDEDGTPLHYTTDNAGAAVNTRANRLNSGGSLGLNLDGQNMKIGIWDGGKVRDTHVLLAGRVTISDDAPTYAAHPTHVAGTMIGGTASTAAKGMASMANLLAYDWNNDISEITRAAANGLLISNHSYGYSPEDVSISQWGKYDSQARAFDNVMFNAPYYLFVNSAGKSRNGGYNPDKNGYDLLAGKRVSKNSIVVAAVGQVTNYTGPGSVPMSSCSSWGPTDDGRIKPDISGKGVNLLSSVSSSNNAYGRMSGTSMASPNVAGTLLLLQQHYNNVKGFFMKAATLKGLAIHTADEAGTDNGPDYRFGWGLLNAEKAAVLITNEGTQSYIHENTLTQGESFSFNIETLNSSQPIVATICWADPTGQVIAGGVDIRTPNLINDLDIRITKGNETNFPWKLNPANVSAAATKGDNIVDNVEKIEIPNPSGKYTITVSHKGTLTNAKQDYSLIISGIASNPLMLSSTTPLLNKISQGTAETSFTFQFTASDTFNESATFAATGLPAGATYSFSPATMTASGTVTLNISNTNGIAPGNYPLAVIAQSSNFSTELQSVLQVQNSLTNGPTLTSPVNNAAAVSVAPTLNWENLSSNIVNYTIEIAKDAAFTTALQTFTSLTNTVDVTALDYGTNYFWRVKANNVCNSSAFSETFRFTTPCSSNITVTITDRTYDTLTASWTNPNAATVFEVQIVTRGTAPNGPYALVSGTSQIFGGLDSFTDYDVYVRSACSNEPWSEFVKTETQTLINHCVDGIFFDSGGPTGNYSNGEYITTVMTPMNAGEKVRVTFTQFELEDQADRLYIYDGPDNNAPYIGPDRYGFTGNISPGVVTSTHPSGKLTFVFYSDGINTRAGFNATVSCSALATTHFNYDAFIFYPNPARNEVHFSGRTAIKSIEIYNILGQLIKSIPQNANNITVDVSGLSNGQYLFKVQTETTVNTVKILKT